MARGVVVGLGSHVSRDCKLDGRLAGSKSRRSLGGATDYHAFVASLGSRWDRES